MSFSSSLPYAADKVGQPSDHMKKVTITNNDNNAKKWGKVNVIKPDNKL